MTMPGLPRVPAADSIDVAADGKIVEAVLILRPPLGLRRAAARRSGEGEADSLNAR